MSLLYEYTKEFLSTANIDNGHGFDHALNVIRHAKKAIAMSTQIITEEQKQIIEYSCLLHDVDDHKFFPESVNFSNAKMLLLKANCTINLTLIIKLISLISCSVNGNFIYKDIEEWMLYPRIADRLESIGYIGIERAIEYGNYINRPMYNNKTIRVKTIEELMNVATLERFEKYVGSHKNIDPTTATTIDHFYDKVIHISQYKYYGVNNIYFKIIADERLSIVQDYILEYWKYHC